MASRRNKLGVPAVNQDPQPPNAAVGALRRMNSGGVGPGGPAGRGRGRRGGGHGGGKGHGGNGGGGHGGNKGPAWQGLQKRLAELTANRSESQQTIQPYEPSQPLDPKNLETSLSHVTQPGDYFAVSSYQPQKGQVDPRDATYWSNVSKLMFNAQQGYGANLLSQTYANTDFSRQQQQGLIGEQQTQRGLAENAMRSGLAFSGTLNRSSAEESQSYLQGVGTANLQKQRDDAASEAARNAILQGLSVDEAAELAQAAAREVEKQQQAAEQGAPEMTPSDVRAVSKALKRALKGGNRGKGHNHGGKHGK